MPIVGGIGTIAGPVLGAVLFGYLQIKLLSSPGAARLVPLHLRRAAHRSSCSSSRRGWLWASPSPPRRRSRSFEARCPMPAERGPRGPGSTKRYGGSRRSRACRFDVARGRDLRRHRPQRRRQDDALFVPRRARAPTSGTIAFRGERIEGLPNYRVVARGLVRTHQIVRPFREMTVAENVSVGAHFGAGRRRGGRRPAGASPDPREDRLPPGPGRSRGRSRSAS